MQNRLAREKSPYLLQHATNPVDWYPWGREAFDRATAEDKPIFLSIGYSTCHWCHVMERESFEDPEVARLMNETFVCIKVDREERPDIDGVYMDAVTAMSGRGGWPLTVIMTPDKKPFYGGTYLPRESRFGLPGMLDLVPRLGKLWRDGRPELLEAAESVASAIRRQASPEPGQEPGEAELEAARNQLEDQFDSENAGFGAAPKFPTSHNLLFLLRRWHRTGDERARYMVEATLDAIRRGGIYDHVGFGFHRYSTDAGWLLPHFEKMLYDQAMLAMAYTEAYLATAKPLYERTAREILTYVLRDMANPEGGFYSAEDADSEGVEGGFYLWTTSEIRERLGRDDADLFIDVFNLDDDGNIKDEAAGQRTGDNVPHMTRPLGEIARSHGLTEAELEDRLGRIRETLFAVREDRVRPHKDDKILTDWNGLVIAALAIAARAFDEPEYEAAAARSADFVLGTMRDDRGRLFHRYRDGEAAIDASADDYAFLIWSLLELYETTFDAGWLAHALALTDDFLTHFWDEADGGFHFSPDYGESLLARRKEIYDGAVPSANSVAAANLLRLARLTGSADLEARASKIGSAFATAISRYPAGYTHLLSAVDFGLGPSHEVVIAGAPGARDTDRMLAAIHSRYDPSGIVILRPPGDSPEITRLAEWVTPLSSSGTSATAYVCRERHCELPTTDVDEMLALLSPNR